MNAGALDRLTVRTLLRVAPRGLAAGTRLQRNVRATAGADRCSTNEPGTERMTVLL
jgi:hypothetical protein